MSRAAIVDVFYLGRQDSTPAERRASNATWITLMGVEVGSMKDSALKWARRHAKTECLRSFARLELERRRRLEAP